ncbi:hypothetical protein ACEPAF_544 [Sanghuangporus sanghuang]
MDVDHHQQQQQQQQHAHTSFPSSDAHFTSSSEVHHQQQAQQSSPSLSQQSQQQQQQQAQQPSPESPSQSLSHVTQPQTQVPQQQTQNQPWQPTAHPHHQQHPHPHLLPISVPVPGSLPAVSASPTSYSPASAHPADSYPFYSQPTGHSQAQSQSQQQQVLGADGGHHVHGHGHAHQGLERSASLSLNISSLSVQSPANLSPLTPSPHPSTASTAQTLSPVTPLSPSTTPHAHHYQTHNRHSGQGQGPNQGSMFAYAPPSEGSYNSSGGYDTSVAAGVTLPAYARAPSSRSSSAASTAGLSTKSSIPRKRSFHNSTALPVATLEVGDSGSIPGYNPALGHNAHDLGPGSFDDVDVELYSGPGGMDGMDGRSGGSPGEGGESSSGDGDEDPFKSLSLGVGPGASHTGGVHGVNSGLSSLSIPSHGGYGPISAKTTGTNNFVTKLYQMINDPKSAMFIQWTELGTSFVVSNVGEFSRTILGTHFKHNNFSSFVRQLNMYGFHKINRTPRGGRTSSGSGQISGSGSADQQVWEFSHHKFLRGRPDLLDEIKRKALDPDPTVKQRVELPGELAAQLGQMRENHRRVVRALEWERAKVDKLVGVVRQLSDVVGRAFPGSVAPFPPELWEPPENNPPIFITSPSAPTPSPASASSRSYGSVNGSASAAVNGMTLPSAFSGLQPFSPGSSPTASEFAHPGHAQHGGHYGHTAYHGHHGGHVHHLNRAHSMQNISYDGSSFAAPSPVTGGPRYDDVMELDASSLPGQGLSDRKRQRTGAFVTGSGLDGKRLSRARSDSAPLGYGAWGAATSAPPTSAGPGTGTPATGSGLGRPRSGSVLGQVNARLSQQSQAGMQTGQGRRGDELMVNISGIGNGKSNSPGGQSPSATSPLVPKAGG